MQKSLYITEKPSVAVTFADVIGLKVSSYDRKKGYAENENSIVTWCYGHLITMAYPGEYSEKYKLWSSDNLPIIPKNYKYKVIEDRGISNQYNIIDKLMNRDDVDIIYACTDSGREGEYIFRLVYGRSNSNKMVKRVWISSYTSESILKGIKEAKNMNEYDLLGKAAYSRAKEDWLFGMNFSRCYTTIHGMSISSILKTHKRTVISIGRVMTCVLGLVASREDEIKNFKPTKSYGIKAKFKSTKSEIEYLGKWAPTKEKNEEEKNYSKSEIKKIIENLKGKEAFVFEIKKKKTKENPPLLFNLAELQSVANKAYKIPVNKTLEIAQELYEKKLISYPRTDCRVMSEEIFDEIPNVLKSLFETTEYKNYLQYIRENGKLLVNKKTKRYVDNKKVSDHYAIIPTYIKANLNTMDTDVKKIYNLIIRRFLAIFYPKAEYYNINVKTKVGNEIFVTTSKDLSLKGWKSVYNINTKNSLDIKKSALFNLNKNEKCNIIDFDLDERETKPPSRYTEGTLILTMEKAGKFVEDEELREQIKTSGIGTSATRSGIIKKLYDIEYIDINKKTQVIRPTIKGDSIYELVKITAKELLNPAFTASWEKGLEMIENGETNEEIFKEKLHNYIEKTINKLKMSDGSINMFRIMTKKIV
jgi:DNA topoisomerase-3